MESAIRSHERIYDVLKKENRTMTIVEFKKRLNLSEGVIRKSLHYLIFLGKVDSCTVKYARGYYIK